MSKAKEKKFVEPKQKDKVCIVGCSDSSKQIPVDKADEFEMWGVNNLYWTLPKAPWTRWFEIHQITKEEDGTWLRRGNAEFRNMKIDQYLKHLAHLDIPVYMREPNPLVPKSIKMPYDDLVARFGTYFTNTISWELAMAIALDFKEIRVYGVDMATDSEYGSQRPSCEYFLGVASGLGIKVWTPDTCDLLKSRFLYGKDEAEETQFRAKLEEVLGNLKAKLTKKTSEMEQAKEQVISYAGAIEGIKNVDRIWKNVKGG